MEILRVEPTPSPNTMKIVLSNKREDNKSNTFTYIEEQQPQFINDAHERDEYSLHLCFDFKINNIPTIGENFFFLKRPRGLVSYKVPSTST